MKQWKTLSSKNVYKNEFLSLSEDKVIDPNGNQTMRNVIDMGEGSVVIIAINEKQEFYLVGQPRYAVNEYSWEFVSGGIKEGESPLVAAQRELAEELNLQAIDWKQIMAFHPNNSLMSRTAYVFIATNLNKIDYPRDSYESIEIKSVTETSLRESINRGEIKDSFTLCGYLGYILSKELVK